MYLYLHRKCIDNPLLVEYMLNFTDKPCGAVLLDVEDDREREGVWVCI